MEAKSIKGKSPLQVSPLEIEMYKFLASSGRLKPYFTTSFKSNPSFSTSVIKREMWL